jgi:hypothetical protein
MMKEKTSQTQQKQLHTTGHNVLVGIVTGFLGGGGFNHSCFIVFCKFTYETSRWHLIIDLYKF